MMDRTFNAVFDGLNSQYAAEQAAVRAQHPCPPLRYKYPCLKFTYKEAMELLRVKGTAKLKAMLAAATDEREKAKLEERIASPNPAPPPAPNPTPTPAPTLTLARQAGGLLGHGLGGVQPHRLGRYLPYTSLCLPISP